MAAIALWYRRRAPREGLREAYPTWTGIAGVEGEISWNTSSVDMRLRLNDAVGSPTGPQQQEPQQTLFVA
jgi:hypothetical protein